MEALIEETSSLFKFMQGFIDEHAVDRIKALKTVDVNLKEKMNIMDWLARNSDYLSAKPITDCIVAYKELYSTDNTTLRNAYIYAKPSSNAIQTVKVLLQDAVVQTRDETNVQRLTVLFSILEPLLTNDQNLEKALQLDLVSTSLQVLAFDSVFIEKPPNYLRYFMRCLTSCLR